MTFGTSNYVYTKFCCHDIAENYLVYKYIQSYAEILYSLCPFFFPFFFFSLKCLFFKKILVQDCRKLQKAFLLYLFEASLGCLFFFILSFNHCNWVIL